MKKIFTLCAFAFFAFANSQVSLTENWDASAPDPNWTYDPGKVGVRAASTIPMQAYSPANVLFFGQINSVKDIDYKSTFTSDGSEIYVSVKYNWLQKSNANKNFNFTVSYSKDGVTYTTLNDMLVTAPTNAWQTLNLTIPANGIPAGSKLFLKISLHGSGTGNTVDAVIDDITVIQQTLAVKDISLGKKVIVNNPFNHQLILAESDAKSVKIFDMNGRLVKNVNNPSRIIETSELKTGNYVVVLQLKDGSSYSAKAIRY